MIVNWKTTLAGIVAILSVIVKLVNGGHVDGSDIGVIVGAIGLFVAKDKNVTGGTKYQ